MKALTRSQVAIIKATVPILAEHGEAITTKFYADLLHSYPTLKNIFNNTHQATGHQARALAGALYAYAAHIDNLGALSPALELICHKHASLFVRPEQYDIVGKQLLETLAAVLGSAATPEILDAWGAAYWQLAHVMIAKEEDLYAVAERWEDWKEFQIVRKVRESEEITSFYLEPVDVGLKVPVFKPGQFISVNVFMEEIDGGVWQARQYSLSDAPGNEYLRISVKKEPGIVVEEPKHLSRPGYISNILHDKKKEGDVVKVSRPFGDFFFEKSEGNENAPIVLISAGVGLTCLTSILNSLALSKSTRPITWIHGARTSKARAFKADIDSYAAHNSNVKAVYFLSSPSDSDIPGQDYTIRGRLDLDKIDHKMLFTEDDFALYFVCGPTQFMLDVEVKLKQYGVDAARIKMELFSTGGVPRT